MRSSPDCHSAAPEAPAPDVPPPSAGTLHPGERLSPARSKDGNTYFYSKQSGWSTNGGTQGADFESLPHPPRRANTTRTIDPGTARRIRRPYLQPAAAVNRRA